MIRTALALAAVVAFLPVYSHSEDNQFLASLPEILHNANGEEVAAESLEGKYVALYFSAHWCPPCRAFTPKLVEFHEKNAGEDFEVVFLSFDNSEEEKSAYIAEAGMPWLMMPGHRSEKANEIASSLNIEGLPTLAVFAPDGSLVSIDGRKEVLLTPRKALKKWKSAKKS